MLMKRIKFKINVCVLLLLRIIWAGMHMPSPRKADDLRSKHGKNAQNTTYAHCIHPLCHRMASGRFGPLPCATRKVSCARGPVYSRPPRYVMTTAQTQRQLNLTVSLVAKSYRFPHAPTAKGLRWP